MAVRESGNHIWIEAKLTLTSRCGCLGVDWPLPLICNPQIGLIKNDVLVWQREAVANETNTLYLSEGRLGQEIICPDCLVLMDDGGNWLWKYQLEANIYMHPQKTLHAAISVRADAPA